jgi:thiol-disulfide isomerase/thioredoxin
MALEFTDANFQDQVLSSDKLSVIDFGAEWCGPCRAISPVIDELSKQYEGKVNIGKVDIEQKSYSVNQLRNNFYPCYRFCKEWPGCR